MLGIQINVKAQRQPCALCGLEHSWEMGPALYHIHTQEPVCLACGRQQAPELVSLIDMGTTADERTASINWADTDVEGG